MNRDELALLLTELDEALAHAFPGPEPVRVLVVGGACLLLAGVTERPTRDIDVIITDLFGTGKATLVYNLTKTTRKLRTIIRRIGKKHGLKGAEWVVNRFFPDPLLQHTYDLSKTLDDLFGKKG